MIMIISKQNLNLTKMESLAQEWVKELAVGSHIVLLEGVMGAGKTQFLRFCLTALGVGDVSSPTYAIHHEYKVGNRRLDHFDLYRLEDEEDLESTGFWEILNRKEALVFIEWADRLNTSSLPQSAEKWQLKLSLGSTGDSRNIQIGKI